MCFCHTETKISGRHYPLTTKAGVRRCSVTVINDIPEEPCQFFSTALSEEKNSRFFSFLRFVQQTNIKISQQLRNFPIYDIFLLSEILYHPLETSFYYLKKCCYDLRCIFANIIAHTCRTNMNSTIRHLKFGSNCTAEASSSPE